ncbi:MAG: HEAT repeat domain-containing protein [Planctomycetota bacterium]
MPLRPFLMAALALFLCPRTPSQDSYNGRTAREWIEQMRQANSQDERNEAFLALEVMADRALLPLVAALEDANREVRLAAIRLLGRLGPLAKDASGRLRQLGTDTDAEIAGWARGTQLAVTAGPERVAELAQALQSDDAPMCISAARALGRLRADAADAVPAMAAVLDRHGELYEQVQVIRVEHQQPLAEGVHFEVVRALGALGAAAGPTVPALGRMLRQHPSPWVRNEVIASLGNMGAVAVSAIPDLMATLDSRDWGERRDAAIALSKIASAAEGNQDEVVQALAHCLGDQIVWVRGAAIDSLQRLGPEAAAAVPDLITCLQSANERDRSNRDAAVEALGAIGPAAKAAVPVLEKVLADGDTPTAGAARALAAIAPETAERLPPVARQLQLITERRLDPEVQRERRIEQLLAMLDDKDEEQQLRAVLGLGRQFARRSSGTLLVMLGKKHDNRLRTALIGILGDLGDPAAAERVRPLLDDADVSAVAGFTLARLGDRASMPRLLKDFAGHPTGVMAVVFASRGVTEIEPVLQQRIGGAPAYDDYLFRMAGVLLHDARLAEPLRRQLKEIDADPGLSVVQRMSRRAEILQDLATIDPASSRELLLEHLHDREPRALSGFIATGLAQLQEPDALPALLQEANHHALNWYIDRDLLRRLDGLRLEPREWEHVPLPIAAKTIASRLSITVTFSAAVTEAQQRTRIDFGEGYEFVPRGLCVSALRWLELLSLHGRREADGGLGWLTVDGGLRIVSAHEAVAYWRAEAERRRIGK